MKSDLHRALLRARFTMAASIGLAALFGAATLSAAGTVSISSLGTAYSENFNNLPITGTGNNSSLPGGWSFVEAPGNLTFAAGTGSSATGDTYAFGSTNSTDRALGTLRSGGVVSRIGFNFVNDSTTTVTALDIAYRGEQWRLGQASREDRLQFQYSSTATALGNSDFTDFSSLDFVAPVNTGSAGALDGNANFTLVSGTISGLTIEPGASFWLRWIDFDATGADDGLAVDDFTLTARGAATTAVVPLPSAALSAGALLATSAMVRRRKHA